MADVNRKIGRRVRIAGFFLLVCSLAYFAGLGLGPRVAAESVASSLFSHRDQEWLPPQSPWQIALNKELLPLTLPGPADKWAGSTNHTLTVTFEAQPGDYTLELYSFESHEFIPPLLSFALNGRRVADVQLKRGGGQPGPYERIQTDLTERIKLKLDAKVNNLAITSMAGSWMAPARLRLVRGIEFNPAKSAYLLLNSAGRLAILAALLTAALFLAVLAKKRPGEAIALTLLVVISSSVALAACELAYRRILIRHPQRRAVEAEQAKPSPKEEYTYMTLIEPNADLDILYQLKPRIEGTFAGYPLRTNSRGMRSPEVGVAKKPGTIRVLGLGDSVMFGWGVADESNALTIIGRRLGEITGRNVETLNMGCPSYNTAVETATYRKRCRQYKPDIVVLIFMENDFGFPGLMLEPVYPWTLRTSYIKEQLRKKLACGWREAAEEEQARYVSTRHFDKLKNRTDGRLTDHDRWVLRVQEFYSKMTGSDAVAGYLKELAAMFKEDGALGIIVYNPINLTVGDPASREKYAGFVVRTAKDAGMEAVDMASAYEKYLADHGKKRMEDGLWFKPNDWHPNAAGHAMIAEEVARILQERGFTVRAEGGNLKPEFRR